MDDLSILASVALNAVPYPSWPKVVPFPSANSFSYSLIKCWQKFAQIFLSSLVFLCHIYVLIVEAATLGEFNHIITYNIHIAEFVISTWMCHEEHLDLLSGV